MGFFSGTNKMCVSSDSYGRPLGKAPGARDGSGRGIVGTRGGGRPKPERGAAPTSLSGPRPPQEEQDHHHRRGHC